MVSKITTAAAPILHFSTQGPDVQILKAIRFFISRRFIYERAATNICDWSLAYSFIYGEKELCATDTLGTWKDEVQRR